jgi:hypothetical protein
MTTSFCSRVNETAEKGANMLRTITIGSCIYVQGIFVKTLAGGRVAVRVDGKIFEGRPV